MKNHALCHTTKWRALCQNALVTPPYVLVGDEVFILVCDAWRPASRVSTAYQRLAGKSEQHRQVSSFSSFITVTPCHVFLGCVNDVSLATPSNDKCYNFTWVAPRLTSCTVSFTTHDARLLRASGTQFWYAPLASLCHCDPCSGMGTKLAGLVRSRCMQLHSCPLFLEWYQACSIKGSMSESSRLAAPEVHHNAASCDTGS